MYAGEDFVQTTPNEVRAISFDFEDAFVTGDNIASANWTCGVAIDSSLPDPNASTHIGPPILNNLHIATATLQGCLSGVRYVIRCTALAASGQKAEFESYINCNERI
jgi:hypothetical protein